MRNEQILNLQNQNVRQRLKSHLNVQLTDSNVVYQTNFNVNQNEHNYQNNSFLREYLDTQIFDQFEQSNSQNSLIHQLRILDKGQKSKIKVAQSSYFGKVQTNNFKDQYKHTINRNQLSPIRKNAQNHYFGDKSKQKISNYEQKKTTAKLMYTKQFNFDSINSLSKFHPQVQVGENNIFSDIQQKISIIPSPVQNKTKNSLYNTRKGNLVHIKSSQFNLNSINKQNHHENNILQHLQIDLKDSTVLRQERLNQLYQKAHRREQNRQKFVSHNRDKFQKKQSKKMFQYEQKNASRSPIQKQRIKGNLNVRNLQTKFKNTNHEQYVKSMEKKVQKISVQNVSKEKQFIRNHRNFQAQNLYKKQSINESHIFKLEEQFNRSKIAKNYHKILNIGVKCRQCHKPFGAITKSIQSQVCILSCNQCDLKNKLTRAKTYSKKLSKQQNPLHFEFQNNEEYSQIKQISMNHPLIGVLYDLQNKSFSEEDQDIMENLFKNIDKQITLLQKLRKILQNLKKQMNEIKSRMRKNTKQTFQAKNMIKKISSQLYKFNLNDQNNKIQQFQKIVPYQYLQELDIWYKIKSRQYYQWPFINESIQMICPLYMREVGSNQTNMRQYLRILTHHFQHNETKISVSQGIPNQLKNLDSATFIVDGSYNIPVFEQINELTLQFHNKRTFRQITSVMENLPISVQKIILNYNHKLNSHISAQKYPLLTKICSLRMCTMLVVNIQNCKDQDDLLNAMKSMTKKKQINLRVTRSLYVRNPIVDGTEQFIQMFKRLGKNIIKANFTLPLQINQDQIYKSLIINSHLRLTQFSLQMQEKSYQSPRHYMNLDIKNQNKQKQEGNLLNVLSMLNNDQIQQNQRPVSYKNKIDQSIGLNQDKPQAKMVFQKSLKLKSISLSILKAQSQIAKQTTYQTNCHKFQQIQNKQLTHLNQFLKMNKELMKQVLEMFY